MVCFKTGFNLKKAIAISFLCFASTILLAHTITPHHHHDGLIYIITAAHGHDCCHPHNDHDSLPDDGICDYPLCNNSISDCESAKIYVIYDNDRRVDAHNSDLFPVVIALFPNETTPLIADDTGLPFRQKPYLITHTEYFSQSPGLRAPPVC